MGVKLPPAESELYRRVDEVLHYIWDPIGVCDAPAARNEYLSYLPQVFRLLMDGVDAERIADCLFSVSTQQMGVSGDRARDLKVAEILLDWKDALLRRA